MNRAQKIDVPKYYQGKEEGTYPRMIRRYSNPHNPTFKSNQLTNAIWQDEYIKAPPKMIQSSVTLNLKKQISEPIETQQLALATKQFQHRKSMLFTHSPQEIQLLTHNFNGRRTPRLQLKNKINQSPFKAQLQYEQNRRNIKARSSLGRYNDESVYQWQSKPYNIISNHPKQIDVLRTSKLLINPQISQSYKKFL